MVECGIHRTANLSRSDYFFPKIMMERRVCVIESNPISEEIHPRDGFWLNHVEEILGEVKIRSICGKLHACLYLRPLRVCRASNKFGLCSLLFKKTMRVCLKYIRICPCLMLFKNQYVSYHKTFILACWYEEDEDGRRSSVRSRRPWIVTTTRRNTFLQSSSV
jgi:hypothetical protein